MSAWVFGGSKGGEEKSLGLSTGAKGLPPPRPPLSPKEVRISPDQLIPNVRTSALNLIYGLILKNNLL